MGIKLNMSRKKGEVCDAGMLSPSNINPIEGFPSHRLIVDVLGIYVR